MTWSPLSDFFRPFFPEGHPLMAPMGDFLPPLIKIKSIEKLMKGPTLFDALWHKPVQLEVPFTPQTAESGVWTRADVVLSSYPTSFKSPFVFQGMASNVDVSLVFFQGNLSWLKKRFPLFRPLHIMGRLQIHSFSPKYRWLHPEGPIRPSLENTPLPIYKLAGDLSQKVIRGVIQKALSLLEEHPIPEWLPASIWEHDLSLPSFVKAMQTIHRPQAWVDISQDGPSRRRLAFDQHYAHARRFQRAQDYHQSQLTQALDGDETWQTKLRANLPFTLTSSQETAWKEIHDDLQKTVPMRRLLQGDVGSGKTVVALLAGCQAIGSGAQVAYAAPTDILVRQHARTLHRFLPDLPFHILTAQEKGKKRKEILRDLADGSVSLVFGTHALFQDNLAFHNLGLVIIDEQHRFGVAQRWSLPKKGHHPHILSLSATPIPRSLLLALYGYGGLSSIPDKPFHTSIETRVLSMEKIDAIMESLTKILNKGERVYWVCPRIEDEEIDDSIHAGNIEKGSVKKRFDILQKIFQKRVAMLHGQMQDIDKEDILRRFRDGDIDILVTTTVIEVGIDVPEATLMIIEDAWRFGLAQLHQLRGRVGRSHRPSFCWLLYHHPLSDDASNRLLTLKKYGDGLSLARHDLMLRGGGDIFGLVQSGG